MIAVVAGVVKRDGQLLLCQRPEGKRLGLLWEFPGGKVELGETPKAALERELKEETGYTVRKLHSLGAFYPSFGSTNEKIWLFAAECGGAKDADREPGEIIRMEAVTRKEFKRLVAEGEFMHGAGLAAWARYLSMDHGGQSIK